MKNWILCQLDGHDNVRYISSDGDNRSFMTYKKFVPYLQSLNLIDCKGCLDLINKYKHILIDTDAHTWQEYKHVVDISNAKFEELMALNSDQDKNKEPEKSLVEKARDWVNGFDSKKFLDKIRK